MLYSLGIIFTEGNNSNNNNNNNNNNTNDDDDDDDDDDVTYDQYVQVTDVFQTRFMLILSILVVCCWASCTSGSH